MIFQALSEIDEIFWGYVAFLLIVSLGLFLTFKTNFFQIRVLPKVFKTFFNLFDRSIPQETRGVHPLKAFFASVGGMVGIGNVVGIVTAVQVGGPGALFWVWFAGIIGAIIKYCEIYLGCKFRVENQNGSYDGGPMYFLRKTFGNPLIPFGVAFLLCIYGIDIYQFSVITDSVSSNWHINRVSIILTLLLFIVYAGMGGVKRIGKICSWFLPFFLISYIAMGIWIFIQEAHALPGVFFEVFKSAFTGHSAVGGFAGASVVLAIQHGIARTAYSADIGIGYDSIIQSESSTPFPEKQARLAIFGIAIDNLICTFSILIVLISGVWKEIPLQGSEIIQVTLSRYFPFMGFYIPFFFLITGYTTIIAYFSVGMKCAQFLSPKWGKKAYFLYGFFAFFCFSFITQNQALLIMSVSGALLLIINLFGIFRLRHEIHFAELEPQEVQASAVSTRFLKG